jgi:flagellar hook-basal body complex protein FliE
VLPRKLAPIIKLGTFISKTERAAIAALMGDSTDICEIGSVISDWISSSQVQLKEDPKEFGRSLAKALTDTAYTMASSSDAQTQAIIGNSKKILGVANAFSNLWNCPII